MIWVMTRSKRLYLVKLPPRLQVPDPPTNELFLHVLKTLGINDDSILSWDYVKFEGDGVLLLQFRNW